MHSQQNITLKCKLRYTFGFYLNIFWIMWLLQKSLLFGKSLFVKCVFQTFKKKISYKFQII